MTTHFAAYLDDQDLIRMEGGESVTAFLPFTLTSGSKTIELLPTEEEKTLRSPLPIDMSQSYTLSNAKGETCLLHYRDIVRQPIFDQLYAYDGEDLGAHYSKEKTTFAFWAPISQEVELLINQTAYPMERTEKGVWRLELEGDWEKASYYYQHQVNGVTHIVHDPYALSSEANSGASYVIDRHKIERPIQRATTQLDPTESIIYELSVRDFSVQKEAGFKHPGKFTALTESPQLNGQTLGFDYLRYLGVTHVQLLPVYDFGSVDEEDQWKAYNWGYDPVQYNVPEGSYASDPNDPYARILELQDTIATYHQANLSVIMDVVYNHVYKADEFAFERIVPGYFYRYDQDRQRTNGTFCGNDVASERAMVRRYIKQSLRQWVELYGFDGFRFDLMGILDIQTMTEIAEELRSLYPNIYLYGEGWKMDTGLSEDQLAHQYKAKALPDFGFFSDNFRDTVKRTLLAGHRRDSQHPANDFANILTANVGKVGPAHFIQPQQAIQYVECHDNATVFDYFQIEKDQIRLEERKALSRLALHLVLLAQGVPFIHAGQEFYRTKGLEDNTYNLPDHLNRLDWTALSNCQEEIAFIKELIAYRKSQPLLRLRKGLEIRDFCDLKWLSDHHFIYTIEKDRKKITILVNIGDQEITYQHASDSQLLFAYPQAKLHTPIPKGKELSLSAHSWILLYEAS
ncbi:pullulanase, type I [Streptococcus sp. F0442]|uniref:type I pullulanase n=1 Tax=Streptococcus sp. F0442 TaxID=999425 RepID=UPI000299265D|nr:type I pullulanase [Streptococcus sp. F0442]EKS18073.1 pullulanase, type I [Streptococcus sp. F0442]